MSFSLLLAFQTIDQFYTMYLHTIYIFKCSFSKLLLSFYLVNVFSLNINGWGLFLKENWIICYQVVSILLQRKLGHTFSPLLSYFSTEFPPKLCLSHYFFFSFFVDHVLTITQTLFVQKIINSFARFWPTSFNFLHTQKEAKDILVPIFNKVSFLFHFAQFSLISI